MATFRLRQTFNDRCTIGGEQETAQSSFIAYPRSWVGFRKFKYGIDAINNVGNYIYGFIDCSKIIFKE